MNKYITPNVNGEHFTANKHYKIMHNYGGGRVLVQNDKGETVIVRVDGQPSARLNWGGKFTRCSDLLSNALNAQENAEALAIRENTRSIVENAIKSTYFWRVKPGKAYIKTAHIGEAFISSGIKPDEPSEAEKQLEAIKKALRCPDGFDVVKQAEIVRTLADALIKLQNSTNC